MTNNLLHGGTTNDEGFKSLSEELFDQIFRANPDVSSNGQVRAAVTAAEKNPHTMEALAKKKEDEDDLTAEMIEAGEATKESIEQQAIRREREEWANSEHELGGVKLNGDEWLELAESMRNDDKVKNAMLQHLMAQGLNKQQAEQKIKEFTDAAAAMGKADCDKTTQDKAAIDKAKNDPNFKKTLDIGQNAKDDGRILSIPKVQEAQIVQNELSSAAKRANILSGENGETNDYKKDDFKNAPNLKTNYEAAQIAVTPLDNPNYAKDQNIGAVVNVQKTANAIAAQSPDSFV